MKFDPRGSRAVLASMAGAALAAACLLPASALADPPIPGGMTVNPWTLVFEDTFDGTAVDTTKWGYRGDIHTNPANNTTPQSWQVPGNVSLDGAGNLKIALTTSSDPTKAPFSGGGLISQRKFRYGYYETRASLNKGSGWHSAFWMMDWDIANQVPTPTRSTEIDGFEVDSVAATSPLNNIRNNIITWVRNSNTTASFYKTTGVHNSGLDLTAFHTYGVLWTEAGVTYYIDGSPVNYVNGSPAASGFQAYPPSAYMHDMVSIWLSTIAYSSGTPVVDPTDNATLWDYVRYWQSDYYVDNSSTSYATGGPTGGPDGTYAETAGTWAASGLTGWTSANPTRYAACGVAGATATWTPNLQVAGNYEIFAWNVVYSSSDTNARYDVLGVGSVPATFVNGSTGSSGWVSLGTYALAQGTSASVQLTSSGTGCARADAVKFVRRS